MRNDGHEFERYCRGFYQLSQTEGTTSSSGTVNGERMKKDGEDFFEEMEEDEDE